MTELADGKRCVDCSFYDGEACDNKHSDHYGHMLAIWHQACDLFQDLSETDTSVNEGGNIIMEDRGINVRCTAHKTCLRSCIAKNVVNTADYRNKLTVLNEQGSCWHNNHTDGKYHEAWIEKVQ